MLAKRTRGASRLFHPRYEYTLQPASALLIQHCQKEAEFRLALSYLTINTEGQIER